MARELPHSVDAERSVLGSMIMSSDAIAEASAHIHAGHFYAPAHQLIFAELVVMWRHGQPTDLVTFTQHLRDRKLIDAVGGAGFVTSLFTFVPASVNISHYLEIVRDKYLLRQIIAECTSNVRKAYENQDDVAGLLKDVESSVHRLTRQSSSDKQRDVNTIVLSVLDSLGDPETALGISTGYPTLDAMVGGLAAYAKIVLAGRISGGKSAFAGNLANSLAVDRNISTAIFTFEMSGNQIVQRIVQIRSGISSRKVVGAEVDMYDIEKFSAAAAEVGKSALHIFDERLDVAGIRAKCAQLMPRVAIVDYLQIIPEKKQKGESKTDMLDRISSETKQIAHQLGITVIELSQLTYDDKGGTYKTRGSQAITADADQLWVIEGDDDETKTEIDKDIAIAKQREGGRGKVHFKFEKPCTKFRPKRN